MKDTSSAVCAVVAHDAGGAEVASSYVRRRRVPCLYVLEGPARKVFERKLGNIKTLPVEEAVRKADWMLCGTSWQSELEFNAIGLARSLGKHSVAFLDHWGNYRERFERAGEVCLPDEIWVGDHDAEAMARAVLSEVPVRLVDNPYFMDIQQELLALPRAHPDPAGRLAVLYVCEPIREHAARQYGNERYHGYVEEDALRYFLSNLGALERPVARIVIRPHPSESPDKYHWVKDEFDLPIEFGGSRSLIEEIADSDVVVGCASMALVVGLLAKKRVISSIPPGGPACSLPQREIESMQDILRKD